MNDPITDMLNRIRNAQAVNHTLVKVPFSKLKYEVAKILKSGGFINDVSKKQKKEERIIDIVLKYEENKPAIEGLKRISKPGQRIYLSKDKIRKVRGGYGIMIISTSKGIMTGEEARKNNLGGEILCEIW